jgi:hypothetical protein
MNGKYSRMKPKKLTTNGVWQRRPGRRVVTVTVSNVQYEQARQQWKDGEVESKRCMWTLPDNYQ